MPRRRPPKHVREATRAALANGEEPPPLKKPEPQPPKIKPTSEAQLSDKIAKAQIQAELKIKGLKEDAPISKPVLNLGISPDWLVGRWADAAGNPVQVCPYNNSGMAFWVTLCRPCGPDINLTLRASTDGKGWYCGSARLDETKSTLTQLIWQFPNGTLSVWVRDLHSDAQSNPYGSGCENYYGYQDFMLEDGAVQHTDGFYSHPTWGSHNLAPGEWTHLDQDDSNFSLYTAQAGEAINRNFPRSYGEPEARQSTKATVIEGGASTHAENTDGVTNELLDGRVPESHATIDAPCDQNSKSPRSREKAQPEQHQGKQLAANVGAQSNETNQQELTSDAGLDESIWHMEGAHEGTTQDDVYGTPHMITPIYDFHNSLIAAPMCYVVVSRSSSQLNDNPDPRSFGMSSTEETSMCGNQHGGDSGFEEQCHDYVRGDHRDYADSLCAASVVSYGGEDDYDHGADFSDADDAVDVESKVSKDDSKSLDDLASDSGKTRSEVSAAARSCPW